MVNLLKFLITKLLLVFVLLVVGVIIVEYGKLVNWCTDYNRFTEGTHLNNSGVS